MNDWKITKFLEIVLTIQVAVLGSIGLESIGVKVPILRELITFIYLLFVPGILMIRIMRMHKLGSIETFLYSVGLSIAILMLVGLLMNTLYPLMGISKPLSSSYLIITFTILVGILSVLSYIKDKNFCDPDFINIPICHKNFLFLCLIPFITILGTYLMNLYQINVVLMFLMVILSLTVILIFFDKIPTEMYPFTIFIVSISLLYSTSLISNYIWGWDIQKEYYLAKLVMENSSWNPNIQFNLNAMLSIVMMPPILSKVSGMNLIWIFKIIYPLIFSLVPVGLYHVFKKQINGKAAFLSCFLFISFFGFFTEMPTLARQEIAELFLVLLIMLILNKEMKSTHKSILLIVFSSALILSHYSIAYIYMGFLAVIALISLITKKKYTITLTFIMFFFIFSLSWYIYTSNASVFATILNLGTTINYNLINDFLNPESVQALQIVNVATVSPIHTIYKYIQLVPQFFIALGIFKLIFDRKKMSFEREYIIFSLLSFLMLLMALSVPFFSSAMNTSRIYQIALMFLSPFFVIGGITFLQILWHIFRVPKNIFSKTSLGFLSIFLVIFLLFNAGFIYEIANDNSQSISLNNTVDSALFNEMEVTGANWVVNVKDNKKIYADTYRHLIFNGLMNDSAGSLPDEDSRMPSNSYTYLGTLNVLTGTYFYSPRHNEVRLSPQYLNLSTILKDQNQIYDNGGSRLYYC